MRVRIKKITKRLEKALEEALAGDDSGFYFLFETADGNFRTHKQNRTNREVTFVDAHEQVDQDRDEARSPGVASRFYENRGHDVSDFRARAEVRTRTKMHGRRGS